VRKTFVANAFLWYGREFLKITHAVSRRQEYIADQLAASVTGVAAKIAALKRIASIGPLYSSYLSQEVVPILNAGFVPPIAAGFNEFLASDQIRGLAQKTLADAESADQANLFDTHPCLRDRLAALEAAGGRDPSPRSAEPAATLIGDHDAHARAVVEILTGANRVGKLKPIEWSAVGPLVYAARWREVVNHYARWLSRYTADALPGNKDGFIRAGSDLVRAGELNVSLDERVARAAQVFAIAVGAEVLDDGWQIHKRPGHSVTLERGSQRFDPFAAIQALAEGRTPIEAWRAECQAMGIAGRQLGRAAMVAAPGNSPVGGRPPAHSQTPLAVNQVTCWSCKRALVVTPESRGKTIKCPDCGTKQQLPL
jgi:hypothetical protein